MEKVSIIIPVYNREKYISRCISSVINQTYKNLEIIIVDDGSTDDSLNIVRSFDDNRLKIIESENKGVSNARNIGIQNASGKYIMFVDSDDYILDEMVENFVREMEETDADLVCGNFANTKIKNIHEKITISSEYSAQDYVVNYYNICPYNCPVSKLYKRALITEPFDVELFKSEDMVFNLNYLNNAKLIIIIPDYSYVANNEDHPSITREYKKGEFSMFVKAQVKLTNFLENSPFKMNDIMQTRIFNNAKISIAMCLKSQNSFAFKKKEIYSIIDDEYLQEDIKLLNDVSAYNKIIIFFIKHKMLYSIIILFWILNKQKKLAG